MTRRIVGLVLAGLFLVLGFGLLATALVRQRADADKESVKRNLMELGQFAARYHEAIGERKPLPEISVVPPGTVVPSKLPSDRRLSWTVPMLPLLDQRRQKTAELVERIDLSKAWDEGGNSDASKTRLRVLLCPARPPEFREGEPVVTQIVGIAGVGDDAASLPLDSPRAGSFRYDSPTPLAGFPDGTSNTLLFGETNRELGPWIRGGPSTVRGIRLNETAIGDGGQFGGIHVGGAWFGFADGGVRFLNERIEPKVLHALATRAGGVDEAVSITD
jgi:Protein of unknown function (DUF1559)